MCVVVEVTTEWSNVCSREISFYFEYIIMHKSLYSIAVSIDQRRRINRIEYFICDNPQSAVFP